MNMPRTTAISAALIAFATPSSAQTTQEVEVDGFVIRADISPGHFGPYIVRVKTASVIWHSQDRAITYTLTDDGDKVIILLEDDTGGTYCSTTSPLLPLGDQPASYFSDKYLCSEDDQRQKVIAREMKDAAASFSKAYDRFRAASVWLHGPSIRRCLETEFHPHGPLCVRYTDGSQ